MNQPARLDLVLVGGGHAHVQVLRSFGMRPEPGVRLTLVSKELEAPYSGMLPGLIAGHYTHDECHIDLVRLARFAGARLIHAAATGIEGRRLALHGRPAIGFDLLSIDVGITPSLAGIEGAADHGLAVKPISSLMPKLTALGAPRQLAIVGAGAAGFELAHAMLHRYPAANVTLIGDLLPRGNARARGLARRSLSRAGIELIENDAAAEITADHVILASGRAVPADAALVTTGAAPAPWLKNSDLQTDADGFIAVRPTLQTVDDDDIFAAGDCASVLAYPREKSGVFAVRQGPPLAENLRARAQGRPAAPFTPQKQYLMLLSTGRKHAIAARGPFAFSGDWVWSWKDRIDRAFMEKFKELPMMTGSAAEPMRCAGCAAKIGPATLDRALTRLDPSSPSRDDAAVIETPEGIRLETVDFFRAFWLDPYVFGEIAATHALSDIYAMGGAPTHAQAIAVIPHAHPRLIEEDLFQLLAGARAVFDREDVALAGGHSSEGAELAVGFAISGTASRENLRRKGGLGEGDVLILTKPLGTGILFAAEMRGLAKAPAVAAALQSMRQSNREAARILIAHGASAMTDVTGFGLLGHLSEMLAQSRCAAEIFLDQVPTYSHARELAQAGIASTLLPENLALMNHVEPNPQVTADQFALLFDPQTSGGLLAGIPAHAAAACLEELKQIAPHAAIVGTVQPRAGKPIRLRHQPSNRR